ncbi:MAG: hypothetical protein V1709_01000 [Planctomycetota bacterium]
MNDGNKRYPVSSKTVALTLKMLLRCRYGHWGLGRNDNYMDVVVREWRCEKCNRLLGEHKNGIVCFRSKEHQLTGEGRIQSVCPKCKRVNVFMSPWYKQTNNMN